jgi:hypothetical protein
MKHKNNCVLVNSTGFFGSSFFSSVSTSVNALSQTIQQKGIPEMNKRFNEFQQKARELPTQLAQMPLDLESERKTFLKNNTENHVKPKGSGTKYEREGGILSTERITLL